ncbi:MAG: 4-hydroxy-3-polyprenylbenzoate decarboxylase [Pseudohongiellaceae bacterium]|jgi:4-hydroxy-3-polyprenylbenzoate decarboxylase
MGRLPRLPRPRDGSLPVPNPDLRSFLADLDRAGELLRITREVDPELEIAAIADRVAQAGGAANKALLFENVSESRFPVLVNAQGSRKRMLMTCGVSEWSELEPLLGDFIEQLEQPRTSWREKISALPLLGRLAKLFPRMRASGPCQEVVHEGDDVDLYELPILTTWPEDGGPFVTLPLVYTKDPVTGARNCGMYRLQRYDKNTLGFHVHTHHTAADHLRRTAELGRQRMPVAVAVGAAPQVVFSAVAPLPPGVDEMLFAAFLQGSPVEMTKCRTVDLEVPTTAEFVIEGYVDVDEKRWEGPFGDHTGFYSLADDYGVLHVTAITHRKDAIWHTTVVGPPPQEDCFMAAAIERLFLPLQRKVMPEVLDMRLPFAGVFHNLMLLRIKKDFPGQGRKSAHTVWGLGQAMFTKTVVVFDEQAPPLEDDDALLDFLLERLDVSRDIEFVLGPTETLDHASRALHYGSKVSVDLTREFPGEGPRAATVEPCCRSDAEIVEALVGLAGVQDAAVIGGRAVAVTVSKVSPAVPRVTMEQLWDWGDREGCQGITDRVLVLDAGERLDDPVRLLWLMMAHIDPERDVGRSANPDQDLSLRPRSNYHPRRIGVDATSKGASDGFVRDWPREQVHPGVLLDQVSAAWSEMGLPGECPR